MNKESKTRNVVRNTSMGVLNNLTLTILNLISRKLFLVYIGIEYLSIGQVINNILSILAFSELGVTNSVLYMLYKSVAEDNKDKIVRILGSYKRLNRIIGCVIFILGLMCMPFLKNFINTSVDSNTVYLIFLMNLLYSTSTYFCSYRQVLVNADQKNYIISKVSLIINIISIIIQCIMIYLTHNYIVYLLVVIIMGLVQNVFLYKKVGEMYPFLKKYRNFKLEKDESKILVDNVKSMFSVKICGIVINNTDNILVSMISTIVVGYCANYTMISTRVKGIISIFHNSIVYSLGIASIEKNAEEKYKLFKKIMLINSFLAGFTTTLLGVLWDDFIILWIGEGYVIPHIIMYSILFNFMWMIISAAVWMFRDTNGLFIYVKKALLVNAALNVILSLALGHFIGVSGVYFATILSDMLSSFWFDARLIYKKIFNKSNFLEYNLKVIFDMGIVFLMILFLQKIFSLSGLSIGIWIFKAVISAFAYIAIFSIIHSQNKIFKSIVLDCIEWIRRRF